MPDLKLAVGGALPFLVFGGQGEKRLLEVVGWQWIVIFGLIGGGKRGKGKWNVKSRRSKVGQTPKAESRASGGRMKGERAALPFSGFWEGRGVAN